MQDRTGKDIKTVKDLNDFLDEMQKNWDKTTDPAVTLKQMREQIPGLPANLLLIATALGNSVAVRRALTKCLTLLKSLAQHNETNISHLIQLLNEVTKTEQRNAWTRITSDQPTLITPYLEIINIIAARENLNEKDLHELCKLITHHDQRGQERGHEKDGSIVFDLVSHEYSHGDSALLNNYLNMLLNLAEAGKIDSNTIYNALRTPLGQDENIGTKIARTYYESDTFLTFIKLCDRLASTQVDQLFPKNYYVFYNSNLKERICEKIENLETPEKIIAMCERARDTETPMGRFMHFKRGGNECTDKWGANYRMKEIYAKALIAREEQHKQQVKDIAKAPQPIAPPLEEQEYMKLFTNADKRDYEKYIRRSSQQFKFINVEEANKALRYAAAYHRNEDLVILLEDHHLDVNTHVDIGDNCADATALYLAVEQNNVEGVRILLEHKADPNIERRLGITPLSFAAINGNADIARMLINSGANVNVMSRYKNSPLYFAARMGHPEIINLLVEHYRHAYDQNIDELVKFLQQDTQLLRSIEDAADGETLLALAKLTDFLIEKGVDKTVIDAMIPTKNTFKNKKLKESLVEAIDKMPDNDRIGICNKILNDPQRLLYKIVRIKRGGLLGKPCRNSAGAIKKIENMRNILKNPANQRLMAANQAYFSNTGSDNDLSAFEQALRDGADLRLLNNHNHLLAMAAVRNDVKFIELLLKYGVDPAVNIKKTVEIIHETIKGHHRGMDLFQSFLKEYGDKPFIKILPEKLAELCKNNEAAALLRKHREAQEQRVAKEEVPAPVITEKQTVVEKNAPPAAEQPAVKLYPSLPPASEELVSDAMQQMQQYLEKAKALVNQSKPALQAVTNPFTGEPLPQMTAATSSDPFAAIDNILSAPAAPKQTSWIEGLKEIDFSGSSTAVINNQLGDLIRFEEPATTYVNPFDELIEQERQAAATKPGNKNPFADVTEEQRDDEIAAQLDALPPAPKGFVLFAANNQQEEKKQPPAEKKQAVMLQ